MTDIGRQFGGETPDNVNEELFDALIRHQIGLMRLSGGVRNRVLELLDATEADLRIQIEDILGRGTITEARQRLLLGRLENIRNAAWDKATSVWIQELLDLATAEAGFVAGIVSAAAPVALDLALPSASLLRSVVTNNPFEGRVLRDWARDIRRADLDRIRTQINIGIVQGETGRDIAARIVGTSAAGGRNGATQITRNQAAAITRTAVTAITNGAKREFYTANSDLFDEELYVATLDDRTTSICQSLDGERFPVGKGPIPPVHFNCRSLRVPLLTEDAIGNRPAKPVTQQQLVREYRRANGLEVNGSRASLPRGHKGPFDNFEREQLRARIGQVDAKVTYQQWLGRQTAEFQDDVLGPTKGRLFRSGGLTLKRFVNRRGDELTLSELAARNADAFRKAGLDPSRFT